MNHRKLAPVIRGTIHAATFCTILLMLAGMPAHGQVAGGTIQGTILDSSGAPIAGVKVSIKNTKTNVVTNVSSNDNGLYTAPNLLPGDYEVSAQASNFAMTVAKGVDLNVGAQLQINLTMRPGTVTEVVEVQDLAATIDLTTSTIGNVVDSTTVRELPLNGRDWTQLATLETGVNAVHTQVVLTSGPDRGNRGFGSQLTISGGRPAQNNYRLDGVSINDYSNGAPGSVLGSNLGVDAVEEFSVLTSNYSAEYGRTSGGVVNAVTKSGTNELHGTAYEFLRNSALDAKNFFDPPKKPSFKRNQFGASAGAPIIKDRTFLFGDYEGDRQDTGISQVVAVPTKTVRDSVTDPLIKKYLQFFPAEDPNNPGTFTTVSKQVIHEDYFTIRGDHKLTQKDSLVGTYVYDKADQTQPDPLNIVQTGNSTKRQIVTAEDTHTFTPTVINTFRFGFNRVAAFAGQNASAINPIATDVSLGVFVSQPSVAQRPAPGITFGDAAVANLPGGLGASPNYRFRWNSFQLYDDAFFSKGIHFLRFGFATEFIQDNILASSDANGVVRFATFDAFLNSGPTTCAAATPASPCGVPLGADYALPGAIKERQIRQHIYAGYVQDDIRWKPNLTLNVGLRYEMATVPTDVHGLLSTLINPYTDDPTSQPNVPHLGNPYFLNPTFHNFEPRIGFAWDPFRTGKTSVRGGFGMFDVLPLPYLYELLVPLSAPFYQLNSGHAGSGANDIQPGDFSGNIAGRVNSAGQVRQSYIEHAPKRNYVMQWNLNVQREFVNGITGMLAYVGSRAVHQAFRADDINSALPVTPSNAPGPIYPGINADGSPVANLANPNVGQITTVTWGGDASYNALQAKLTARVGKQLQAQASYTWGKGIDTGSATVGGDTFSNSISSLPVFNPALRRGPSDFNIAHNFVLSYTWVLPTPHDLPAAANWVLGGWQLGGVVQLSTGVPFTPIIGSDLLGQGSTDPWNFPDRLSGTGCGSLVTGNPDAYVKYSCLGVPLAPASDAALCFQDPAGTPGVPTPPAGQITCTNRRGNLGRNSLTGPALRNFDFSLFKNIPVKRVSESFNIQFRIEMFNLLNHPNFAPPIDHLAFGIQPSADQRVLRLYNPAIDGAPSIRSPGPGTIDSTVTNSRQIQFGLKFVW